MTVRKANNLLKTLCSISFCKTTTTTIINILIIKFAFMPKRMFRVDAHNNIFLLVKEEMEQERYRLNAAYTCKDCLFVESSNPLLAILVCGWSFSSYANDAVISCFQTCSGCNSSLVKSLLSGYILESM